MPEGPNSAQPGKSALRCVIWHSAAVALPGELLSSLSKRIGQMSVTTDEFSAFAELCKIERERRAALAIGQPPPVAAVLLLVHPRQLPGAAEVYAAARLYAPSCTIWQYDRSGDGANPKLRSVVEDEVHAWSLNSSKGSVVSSPAPSPATQPGRAPATASVARPQNGARHDGEPAARATPLAPPLTQLTEDELKMLLSDDPVFPPAAPRSARGGAR